MAKDYSAGAGDGMDDMIPANIDGEQDVLFLMTSLLYPPMLLAE